MAKSEVVLDIKQLEAFRDRIKDLDAEREAFMVSTVKNLAARLLRKVILRTPTDTGQLKNSWTVEKVIKEGTTYKVTIINSMNYAAYVEFGHRQEVGRYVPAIKKRLVKPWVKGKFMLTISEHELEGQMENIIAKRIENWLKKLGEK